MKLGLTFFLLLTLFSCKEREFNTIVQDILGQNEPSTKKKKTATTFSVEVAKTEKRFSGDKETQIFLCENTEISNSISFFEKLNSEIKKSADLKMDLLLYASPCETTARNSKNLHINQYEGRIKPLTSFEICNSANVDSAKTDPAEIKNQKICIKLKDDSSVLGILISKNSTISIFSNSITDSKELKSTFQEKVQTLNDWIKKE